MNYNNLTDEQYNEMMHEYYAEYLEDQVDCHING